MNYSFNLKSPQQFEGAAKCRTGGGVVVGAKEIVYRFIMFMNLSPTNQTETTKKCDGKFRLNDDQMDWDTILSPAQVQD